jgi:hypothetical protein
MQDIRMMFPALVIARSAVAAVWLYAGLWNKVLGRAQREAEVVAAVSVFGPRLGQPFLKLLGVIEVLLAA